MTDKGLPEGWRRARIGDVFNVVGGGTPSTGVPRFWEGTIPWVTSADLESSLRLSPRKFITQEAVEESATNLVPKDSVIVATRVGLGKVGIADRDACFSQDCQALLPAPHLVEPRFVAHQLSVATQEFHHTARGTTISGVTKKQLLDLEFRYPELEEQRRVVAKIEQLFSDLDAGVAALERAKANLARYRTAVLKAAVEGTLTEQWRQEHPDVEPAAELVERCERQSAEVKHRPPLSPDPPGHRELPPRWTWATVDQVSADVRYGSSAKASKDPLGIPILRMGNLVDGDLELTSLKYLPANHSEFPDLLLQDGDLLFNRTNSAELVGKTAVYRGLPRPCSFASYLIRVHLLSGVIPQYLCHVLNSDFGRGWISGVASQQVGQANVNGTKLKAFTFPLPPYAEQQAIVEQAESLLSLAASTLAACASALPRSAALRNAVLASAFNGELV